MEYVFNDGGRAASGYKGDTGDCVVRSIAIASGKPYQEVYDALNVLAQKERRGKRKRKISNARTGVFATTARKYCESIGAKWTPTMTIGSGCKVHLKAGELPKGRLVVSVSKHWTAVIGGVINDTHNPDRGGTRCVYGFLTFPDREEDAAAGHTPGPWRVGDAATTIYGPKKEDGSLPKRVASLSDSPFIGNETRANARLIAAAPALLEVVKELNVELAKARLGLYRDLNWQTQDRADAVIAQAEGR